MYGGIYSYELREALKNFLNDNSVLTYSLKFFIASHYGLIMNWEGFTQETLMAFWDSVVDKLDARDHVVWERDINWDQIESDWVEAGVRHPLPTNTMTEPVFRRIARRTQATLSAPVTRPSQVSGPLQVAGTPRVARSSDVSSSVVPRPPQKQSSNNILIFVAFLTVLNIITIMMVLYFLIMFKNN